MVGWRGQAGTENLGAVSGVCLWPGYKRHVLLFLVFKEESRLDGAEVLLMH